MKIPSIKIFYKFFARLSKREKFVFYCAVFFVGATLIDGLIISPISYKLSSYDQEIQEKKAGIRRSLYLLTHKDKIDNEIARYSSYLASDMTEQEEMTSILKIIENIADKTAVYLIDMKPGGFKVVDAYKQSLVKLNCEAQMNQITEFIYRIESSEHLFTILSYQIGPKTKRSSVAKCSMTISKVTMPSIKGGGL